jgi:hypothetical protein
MEIPTKNFKKQSGPIIDFFCTNIFLHKKKKKRHIFWDSQKNSNFGKITMKKCLNQREKTTTSKSAP